MKDVRDTPVVANTLTGATTATAVTREVVDMLQILPARAAASILLMIFDTIEAMQANKMECTRLAHRCYRLLSNIRKEMEGRWETSPSSLIHNFEKLEQTLTSIHTFMKEEAKSRWHSRLMRRRNIERDIADFTAQLEDAARSFEISILISIQHIVEGRNPRFKPVSEDTLPPYTPSQRGHNPTELVTGVSNEDISDTSPGSMSHKVGSLTLLREEMEIARVSVKEEAHAAELSSSQLCDSLEETDVPEDLPGFQDGTQSEQGAIGSLNIPPKYHQSDIKILGRSRISEGWWSGCVQAKLGSRVVLLKRYEGDHRVQAQCWLRDVTLLSRLQHACLPKLVGVSHEGAPTLFLLLENEGSSTLHGAVKERIKHSGVEEGHHFLVRIYVDIIDLCLYLQHELQLSKSEVQSYVENASFRTASNGRVCAPGPPSSDTSHAIVFIRRWGLVRSVQKIIEQTLTRIDTVKDPSLHLRMSEVSAKIRDCWSRVTDSEPCPDWLRELA